MTARLLAALGLLGLLLPLYVSAETTHVVVSQLQVLGDKADDEFVELYNPTANETTLDGWSLQYKSAGVSKILKKNFPSDASIAPRSYYLVTNSGGTVASGDMAHSSFSMAADGGTVLLVNSTTLLADLGASTVVDKVGYGTATVAEGNSAPTPPTKQAIERKPGGTSGNATDRDNNAADFFVVASHPRSKSAQAAPETSTGQTTPALETTTPATTPPAATTSSTTTAPATIDSTTLVSPTPSSTAQNVLPAPAAGTIVLNEIVADPSEGNEWIELYSASAIPIALDGATLEDAQGTIATLLGSIGGENYFLVVQIPATRLNNSGDAVVLKWKDGTVLNRMTYGDENDGTLSDNAPTAGKRTSLVRIPDGTHSGNDAIDWKVTATPTRGTTNRITTPSTGSTPAAASRTETGGMMQVPIGAVRINEWVADPPDNGSEWVELINTAQEPVSLAGWVLEEGGGEQTKLSGVLGTSEFDRYLVLNNPKGALNNSGDRLHVRDPSKRFIDDVAYGAWANTASANAPVAQDPFSVARILESYTGRSAKDFAVTSSPTPNAANRFTTVAASAPTMSALATANASTTTAATSAPSVSLSAVNLPPTVFLDAADEAVVGELAIFDASESIDPEGRPLIFTWEVEGALAKTTAAARLEHRFRSVGRFLVALTVSDGTHKTKLRHRIRVVKAESEEAVTKRQEADARGHSERTENEPRNLVAKTKVKKIFAPKNLVTLTGVVTAPFGIIGSRKFVVEPIGIINVSRGTVPELEVGTRVRVVGRAGNETSETAFYLNSSADIAITGKGGPAPSPEPTAMADLDEASVGHVVKITGEVEAVRGKQVTISEDGEQLALVLPAATKLSGSLFVEGDAITATGILRKTSAGFALVPRQPEDVQWLSRAPAESSANQPQQASGLTTSLVTAALAATLYGLWRLVSARKPGLITFPELEEPKMLTERPRPLLLDGTLLEEKGNDAEAPRSLRG